MNKISIIPYFYDVVVILIISYNVFYCYRKGFVKSFVSAVSYCIGLVVSHIFGGFILKNILKNSVVNEIEDRVLKNFNFSDGFKNVFNGLEGFNSHICNNSFASSFFKVILSRILFILIFFFTFSFFRFIKRYIFKLTRKVRKTPIFGAIDGLLGALCGVLKAFIFLFIFAIICFIVIALTKDELNFLNTKTINSTYLFFLFYKITYFLK